jgi:hypothetical protein
MKRLLLFMCVLYGMHWGNAVAQTPQKTDPVIPLPSEMAELFKYNNMPVSLMTGVPQISYPLYEINTGKIKLPISLSYHASGIKVSQKATWVGLGWSLMPGGAIGRTIRGSDDEDEVYGWSHHFSNIDTIPTILNYETMRNWQQGTPDPQPDFFDYNFTGKNGRFMYSRISKSFVTIPYQPVKVSKPDHNSYLITDDDGTRYFFEYPILSITDNADQAIQRNVVGWNLTKIISNDNSDTLFINYESWGGTNGGDIGTDVVNTFNRLFRYNTSVDRDDANTFLRNEITQSTTYISNTQPRLKEVIFRQGKVTFFANTTRKDNAGNALDSMVVYSKNANGYQRVQKVAFDYTYFFDGNSQFPTFFDYRLKLLGFTKQDIYGGQPERYQFGYNSKALPSTLSYAADYWGFYNGALSNSTLMPAHLPVQTDLQKFGNLGTADRSPSDSFILAGILNRIIYPTGGYTDLQYESNKHTTNYLPLRDTSLAYGELYGGGRNVTTTKNLNFQVPAVIPGDSHPTTLTLQFSAFSPNALDVAQQVILNDLTSNTQTNIWSSDNFNTEYSIPHTITYSMGILSGHSYQIAASVNDLATTSIIMSVKSSVNDSTKIISIGGGIRVQSVSSYTNDGKLQNKEVYKYGADEGGIGYMPGGSDAAMYENFYAQTTFTGVDDQIGCAGFNGSRITYIGQSAYPSITFQGAAVLYPYVTKYQYGNDVPNGKTIYQYLIPNDYVTVAHPTAVGGKETIDNSMYDQLLNTEHTYRYNPANQSYTLLKQVTNNYAPYNIAVEKAYSLWIAIEYLTVQHCFLDKVTDYGFMNYNIKSGGFRLSNTKEQIFDDNGNVLLNNIDYMYNSKAYLKKSTRINSKGDTVINVMNYPGEHTGSDPNASVLNKMVYRNMIRQPYWQGSYTNNILQTYKHTIFGDQWGTNDSLIATKADTTWNYGDNTITPSAITYQAYGKYGNIQQLTDQEGITSSYTWNADGTYPLSQTTGASLNQVLYNGFEDAGSWTGVTSDATQVYSGHYAGMVENAGTYTNQNWVNVALAAVTSFKYSGWIYSNGANAGINLVMKRTGETGAYSYIDNVATSQTGKWVYVEKEFAVPADVTSFSIRVDNSGSGKVWFDDIRLRPSSARMSSYNFTPLVGMTSKSDEGNHIMYYEFDGLGRLKLVRDKDRNILKTFCYNYVGEIQDCSGTIFYNTAQSQTFTKTCTGSTGTPVIYVVDAGKYSSPTSLADANAKAQADIAAHGQAYADLMGNCLYVNTVQSQSFTKTCVNSVGSVVVYTVNAGKDTSLINVADANTKALADIAANGQAYADANGTCTYSNTLQTKTFIKTCVNGVGSSVIDTVPAGQYTSTISVTDANTKAQVYLTANGQAYADQKGICKYYNTVQSQSFNKVCANGGIGSPVIYTVAAKTDSSVISVADANAKALARIVANGQNNANTLGSCTYSNDSLSKTATKVCPAGSLGTDVVYWVVKGKYTTTVSKDSANKKAQADLNANAQTYANTNGVCQTCNVLFSKKSDSGDLGTFNVSIKNSSTGVSVYNKTYTSPTDAVLAPCVIIATGATYTITISAMNNVYATVNGTEKLVTSSVTQTWTLAPALNIVFSTKAAPIYSNAAYTKSFTKTSCRLDSVGTSVDYTVPAATYTSLISQAYVDSLATVLANANGPANANANGYCFAAGTNVAVRQKPGGTSIGSSYTIKVKKTSDNSVVLSLTYLTLDGNLPLFRSITAGTYIVEIAGQAQLFANVNGVQKTISAGGTQTWTTSTLINIIVSGN